MPLYCFRISAVVFGIGGCSRTECLMLNYLQCVVKLIEVGQLGNFRSREKSL